MIKKVKFIDGQRIVVKIYDKNEHNISINDLDADAVKLVKKIKSIGAQGYIVGGAVRDLILGKKPSDFDVATSLKPSQIRRYFHNSRIIGKRFKLALLMYSGGKQIELATFRSMDSENYEQQSFGIMESDAFRRDFTVNALYFDPVEMKLYDFHNSFDDLKSRSLVSIIELEKTFKQDPVRMIRAVKYSIKDSLKIEKKLKIQIERDSHLIQSVSKSRMAEEIAKILLSGTSFEILTSLNKLGLLKYILPSLSSRLSEKNISKSIQLFDEKVLNKSIKREACISLGIASILKGYCDYDEFDIDLEKSIYTRDGKRDATPALKKIKDDFNDLNFSNIVYYNALRIIQKEKSRPSDSN